MMPIRLATTGKLHGPDVSSVLTIFGKEETVKRLEAFLND